MLFHTKSGRTAPKQAELVTTSYNYNQHSISLNIVSEKYGGLTLNFEEAKILATMLDKFLNQDPDDAGKTVLRSGAYCTPVNLDTDVTEFIPNTIYRIYNCQHKSQFLGRFVKFEREMDQVGMDVKLAIFIDVHSGKEHNIDMGFLRDEVYVIFK